MSAEDIIEMIEQLKASLTQVATGGGQELDEAKYKQIRKALLQHPELGPACPEWLRRGTTHWEAVSRIRAEAGEQGGKWQRRRAIIADGLNPLIDSLESSDLVAADSMVRLDRLGGGGFGEVFRYHHKHLGMDFALKLLSPAFASDADHAVERFFREARILFAIRHPNIVRVYDVGLLGRRPFIRMELIEGRSLAKVLQDAGGMAIWDARRAICDLADALAYAHDAVKVLHRDLKPSNIMLEKTGRIVVVDFGLGAFVEGDITSRITRTGETAAGGLHTAPELVANPKLLDHRTDVYSLGAIWYELLTGHPPGGARIEAALEDLHDLTPTELDLLLRSLGPLASRPSAADLRDALSQIT